MQDNPLARPWTARAVPGVGRGRRLKIPTINLALEEVPADLSEGIYACRVVLHYENGSSQGPLMAAVHYGPRPVFKDTKSFEVHLIDAVPAEFPKRVEVTVVKRLRDVRDFESSEALLQQIGKDVEQARGILGVTNVTKGTKGTKEDTK